MVTDRKSTICVTVLNTRITRHSRWRRPSRLIFATILMGFAPSAIYASDIVTLIANIKPSIVGIGTRQHTRRQSWTPTFGQKMIPDK
jgi:hypothetical protein